MSTPEVTTVRRVTDEERRARLGRRHALGEGHKVTTPEEAAASVVCLHATEPASIHLAAWARTRSISIDDVERSLYATRSLVRQQSMRETIFVFPRELIAAVLGSAAARIAGVQGRRLVKDLERWGPVDAGAGEAWVQAAEAEVLEHLSDGVPRSARQLRSEVPAIDEYTVQSPEKSWGGRMPVAPRVLAQLSMRGVVARAANGGAWHTSRPLWTTAEAWWRGSPPQPLEPRAGYAELVSRWLWAYGPGTVEDIAWWLGATKTIVKTALADLAAQPVALDDDSVGWLRADDVEPVGDIGHWVALLPLFDPTIMGWQDRRFCLGAHRGRLFDSIGNAGTSAWVDGRAVGVWVQDDLGKVRLHLLEAVTRAERQALDGEARRLSEWLAGQQVLTIYPSPAMLEAPRG